MDGCFPEFYLLTYFMQSELAIAQKAFYFSSSKENVKVSHIFEQCWHFKGIFSATFGGECSDCNFQQRAIRFVYRKNSKKFLESFPHSIFLEKLQPTYVHLHGPELAVSCRHSSVMQVVGHTSPTYCRYLRGI